VEVSSRKDVVQNRESRRFELDASPDAPRAARRALEQVGKRLGSALYDDLLLLVTELVTNGVRHAGVRPGDSLALLLSVSDQRLRVEVQDPGRGFVPSIGAPREGGAGWGLFLVDRIADRWGVGGDRSTRVWFEIDRATSDTSAYGRSG
jgi:anti-sigma regulatory factor (Ser/Thr protein kinase)